MPRRVATKQIAQQKLFRLWCGRKRYTNWLSDESEVWRIALREKLAYGDEKCAGLGPLTWIEIGERLRPKARTVPIGRRGIFMPGSGISW